jgi:dTDP-4-dehydrorhamnose reductase
MCNPENTGIGLCDNMHRPTTEPAPVILLLGKKGQLSFELQRGLSLLGRVIAMDRIECDLLDHQRLEQVPGAIAADVVVNAAAHADVDRAET